MINYAYRMVSKGWLELGEIRAFLEKLENRIAKLSLANRGIYFVSANNELNRIHGKKTAISCTV